VCVEAVKVADVDECGCMKSGRPRVGDSVAADDDDDDDGARAFQAPTAALASASLLAGTMWCMTENRHGDISGPLDSSWALPRTYTWRLMLVYVKRLNGSLLINTPIVGSKSKRKAGRKAGSLESKE
jgi:hypothetical protein